MMKNLLTVLMLLGVLAQVAVADVWEELEQYTMSDESAPPPVAVNDLIVNATPEELGSIEEKLIAIVASTNATPEAMWFSCRMLQRVGTEECVPVLSELLCDEIMSHYARLTLERLTDSRAAGKALLKALSKAPDDLKIGIIGSLGRRREEKAVKTISRYVNSDNPAVSKAALAALADIGGRRARKAISKAKSDSANVVAVQGGLLAQVATVDDDIAADLVRDGVNPGVRAGAFRTLAELDGDRAKRVLTDVLGQTNDPIRASVLRAAMESDFEGIRNELVASLPQSSTEDQRVVLGAISDLHLSQYETNVVDLLVVANHEIRDTVIRTLGAIGGEACFEQLYQEYQRSPGKVVTDALAQLPAPVVDARLMATVAEDGDVDKRLASLGPLVLRNPKGCADLLNTLVAPGQPEVLRKASLKALESVGNVDSCKSLVAIIVGQGDLMREAQKSLKRLCLAMNQSRIIWESAFKPALDKGDVATDQALLAIVDGVATAGSFAYVKKQLESRDNPLHEDAVRALQRWPGFEAGDVWVEMAAATNAVPEELAAAERGLKRILTRGEIRADKDEKLKLALVAMQQAPSLEFKQSILTCYAKPDGDTKRRMKKIFAPLLDDQELAAQVEALLN